jgi:hypothetical protein
MLKNVRLSAVHPLPVTAVTVAAAILLVVIAHLGEIGKLVMPRREVYCYSFIAGAMVLLFLMTAAENVSFLYQRF